MEQQKEGIRQEFMLLNWYLKEHLASAVRIAAFIGVFSLLCFLRNVPQDVTVYMILLSEPQVFAFIMGSTGNIIWS